MATKNDFESALKELEAITAQLEGGDCSLDESIALFEKGMKLSGECEKRLSAAKQKIRTLTEAEKEAESHD